MQMVCVVLKNGSCITVQETSTFNLIEAYKSWKEWRKLNSQEGFFEAWNDLDKEQLLGVCLWSEVVSMTTFNKPDLTPHERYAEALEKLVKPDDGDEWKNAG